MRLAKPSFLLSCFCSSPSVPPADAQRRRLSMFLSSVSVAGDADSVLFLAQLPELAIGVVYEHREVYEASCPNSQRAVLGSIPSVRIPSSLIRFFSGTPSLPKPEFGLDVPSSRVAEPTTVDGLVLI
ncbi:hypothetical protein DFH06DRAFT_1336450 [Mycena polygramma]|nr:hypothetical protein DFH06DRAFT_1336450 [Mycena polygramma]